MDRDHSTSKHKQLDNERIHNESHEMYINYFKKRTNTQCIDYGYTCNLPPLNKTCWVVNIYGQIVKLSDFF